ncbi:MAG: formate/nitrite transporter family protein [Candidatus Deferrimicrobiaceae bacterium]
MRTLSAAPWTILVTKLGYTVGFLIVVLGRQQLFTENTITVILPLLRQRDLATFLQVVRIWSVVLAANLAGALAFAWTIGNAGIFEPEIPESFAHIGINAMATKGFFDTFIRAIFAGWLIALMVWLLPAAETARVSVIIIITYMVAIGNFTHIIAGSVEAIYTVVTGSGSWGRYLAGYMVPALLGNVVGGVSLVAALNHAQVTAGGNRK